jgi:hypothetical protein
MSISTQPLSDPHSPPAKGVSITTLILSLALAVSTTAAVCLAVLYFRHPADPGGMEGGGPLAAVLGGQALVQKDGDEPLAQKDTVSPQTNHTGTVYYPIPYALPPNLKLAAPKRQYDIVKQDELGFTWMARPLVDDFRNGMGDPKTLLDKPIEYLAGLNPNSLNYLKPDIQYEDFTWEAKGQRAGRGTARLSAFPQDGTFNVTRGEAGEVYFPIPYEIAPNVELSGDVTSQVIIVECRPTGFKWKHSGDTWRDRGTVTWKAKGIRATEVPRPKPQ